MVDAPCSPRTRQAKSAKATKEVKSANSDTTKKSDTAGAGGHEPPAGEGDFYANGVPRNFVARCQKSLAILMTWAQMDMLKLSGTPKAGHDGRTPSFFAIGRCADDGAVVMDTTTATLDSLGWSGCSIKDIPGSFILLPDLLSPDESNQVMTDLASKMEASEPAFVARVSNDVWMPSEGLTPEGIEYIKRLQRSEQLKLSGSVQLWTAEFLSPGNVWYAKSSHTVYAGRIAPSDFLTAAVSAVVPSGVVES